MKEYSSRSRDCLKLFSYFLLSAVSCLMLSLETMAQTGSRSLSIALKGRQTQVSFTNSSAFPEAGDVVQFTDTSNDRFTSWLWDFDDGSTSSSQNPNHAFAAAGSYDVILTVTNDTGSNSTSLSIAVGYAQVITAASASFADVSAAVSRAKAGDTVIVPAGSARWDRQLVLTKGISIIGAGIGQTVITSGYSDHSTYTNYLDPVSYLIAYTPSSPDLDEAFRLSGFTIDFNATCYGIYVQNTTLSALTKIRIDHCNLGNSYSNGMELIMTHGTVYGCIDNNIMSGGYFMFRCFGLNETTWNNLTFSYGTADNLYFEDNVISCNDSYVEAGLGGRYCFRHNTLIYTGTGYFQAFDAHGNQGAGSNLATMGIEIYENTINAPNATGGQFIDHRGGMGLVYNNNMVTSSPNFVVQTREESLDSTTPPANGPGGQPQHISASYYWGDKINGAVIDESKYIIGQTVDYGGSIGLVPQWDVDCWRHTTPFTGASGVGVGLFSARPATCKTGVAYWATDTKTLYRATAPNTWGVYYTPYTYPHPLRDQP